MEKNADRRKAARHRAGAKKITPVKKMMMGNGEVPIQNIAAGIPPEKDRFLAVSILVAAAVIGGAMVFSTIYGPSGPAPAGNAGAVVEAVAKIGERDAILGNPNAKVTIVEYGDYQCPFCTRYHREIQPEIISKYIDTGKAKMIFRDFAFLGPESLAAAEAAECANDQKKRWEYHDALYSAEYQDEVSGGGEHNGNLNRALFVKIARDLGLNATEFASCIDSNKHGELVVQSRSAASAAGVNSTPTTFINGKMVVDEGGRSVGANGAAVFQAIEAALKG